ncbi:MAG: exodeoxyribonuclease V subunit gamma [Proteobacteria bacterium]|nr:exodeoxyribonuclease V subunit gamma [Pseudomonadota bacterium]
MRTTDADPGLLVYRASRLENLLDPLLTLLDAALPASVLAAQTVLVTHPGMRAWLTAAIARRRGCGSIVANLESMLPGVWLERLAQEVLKIDDAAIASWRREALRWHIHELLPQLDDAGLRASLQGQDAPRRRFQLADRLARMFVQYLVYRTDWLQAWDSGRDPTGAAGFLVPLWQGLRRQIGYRHRGERMADLVDALGRSVKLSDDSPLHVFGLSHIAPAELAVLQALSRHRSVVLYVSDPCREFWAGLPIDRGVRNVLRQGDPNEDTTESAFQQQVRHPLLGNSGRIGQHLMLMLEDVQAKVDTRDHRDERQLEHRNTLGYEETPTSRLAWLQESIRRGERDLPLPKEAVQRDDASLRVHACHTRLRELEVLRDALLWQLGHDPDLRPSKIVVMAADIRAYAPLLPAVFGAPGSSGGPLPWQLADVALASSDPLYTAFRRLLELPYARFTAPEIIDLLSLPPVARRWDLDPDDLDTLEDWLRQSRVAWGLDGAFRGHCGAPPIADQTFAWGMERLLAGYALGQDAYAPQAFTWPDGQAVLPLPGIAGAQAARLGTLYAALAELARWHALGERQLTASAWAQELENRIPASLRVDASERRAQEALDELLQVVRELRNQPKQCGLDPQLPFVVVREFIVQALDAIPERQRFLRGGITFCGMVPQRAIPFDVVAVLGLDEGALPRSDTGAGIDPIIHHRRLGDRDTRNDDRWLFLQTLMAARKVLHLSYIGANARDGKPRNPAAPLAELMDFLDEAVPVPARVEATPVSASVDAAPPRDSADATPAPATAAASDAETKSPPRPWLVRHPLQPFDARYRDGVDPAMFAFADTQTGSDRDAQAGPAAFTDDAATDPSSTGKATRAPASAANSDAAVVPASERLVTLRELLAFFKDPARDYLSGYLRLRLDAFAEDGLRESESLEPKFDPIERVGRRVFLDALTVSPPVVPAQAPDWLRLSGLLPPGRPGAQAWADEAEQVRELLDDASVAELLTQGLPPPCPLRVDVPIGPWRVQGEATRVRGDARGYHVFEVYPNKEEEDLGFKERIGLFLEWALLRLDPAHAQHSVDVLLVCPGGRGAWQEAITQRDRDILNANRKRRTELLDELRRRVMHLLDIWSELREEPQWYFPKTSWIAATADPAKSGDKVSDAWDGHTSGERTHAPGYARLLAGDESFSRGTQARAQLDAMARRLYAAIALDEVPGTQP